MKPEREQQEGEKKFKKGRRGLGGGAVHDLIATWKKKAGGGCMGGIRSWKEGSWGERTLAIRTARTGSGVKGGNRCQR